MNQTAIPTTLFLALQRAGYAVIDMTGKTDPAAVEGLLAYCDETQAAGQPKRAKYLRSLVGKPAETDGVKLYLATLYDGTGEVKAVGNYFLTDRDVWEGPNGGVAANEEVMEKITYLFVNASGADLEHVQVRVTKFADLFDLPPETPVPG
jgi:hypothetical protein